VDKDFFNSFEEAEALSEINVTPFIDIMLVLLIIFMVTAPLMLGGVHINLPKSVGDPMTRPERPLIISLDAQNRVFADKEEVKAEERQSVFQALARESANGEVYVRGDGTVRYSEMMDLMSSLGRAGFARVTLVTDLRTNSGGSSADPAADGSSDGPTAEQNADPAAVPAAVPTPDPAANPTSGASDSGPRMDFDPADR
jgi:biopolymer transport protein ExbD